MLFFVWVGTMLRTSKDSRKNDEDDESSDNELLKSRLALSMVTALVVLLITIGWVMYVTSNRKFIDTTYLFNGGDEYTISVYRFTNSQLELTDTVSYISYDPNKK